MPWADGEAGRYEEECMPWADGEAGRYEEALGIDIVVGKLCCGNAILLAVGGFENVMLLAVDCNDDPEPCTMAGETSEEGLAPAGQPTPTWLVRSGIICCM